jgi:hypothetical protein
VRIEKRTTTRRNETRDLTRPILVALNRIPGVRMARNNSLGKAISMRFYQHLRATGAPHPDAYPMTIGLGVGSADLVGVVACDAMRWNTGAVVKHWRVGRVCCLEVKWPGSKPAEDQRVWMRTIRSLGGFASVVHSVEEAVQAVSRCRSGDDE